MKRKRLSTNIRQQTAKLTEENADGDIDDLIRAEFTLVIFPGTKKIIFMRHENIFMKALMTLKSYAKNFIKETNTL